MINVLKKCAFVSILCGLLGVSTQLQAQGLTEVPHSDGILYYRIGGGRHISIPPSLTITTINLSASIGFSALNCGKFDKAFSIEASLNQLRDGVDNAINAIESAAGAAIANLPGYILQKANPGLYDLFQNALLRAQAAFSIATKSCERMQYEISQNINPYAEWITLSHGDSWKRSIGAGEKNIHEAVDDVEDGHNDGVRWVGGIQRAGSDQEPIRVLAEVASAGLNILSNRAPETTDNLPSDAALRRHFQGPDDVTDWVEDVLGDLEIGVCDDCDKGSLPGKGLIPYIEEQANEIARLLSRLVSGADSPNRDNLEEISAPGVAITYQVIEALRNQSSEERAIIVNKLAQEIAESRTMEEAMIVRRFLLTGKKDGDISAVKMAVEEVDKALVELEKEINNVIFERRVRGEFLVNTVLELLVHDNAKRQSGLSVRPAQERDERPMVDGAVKP